MEIDKKVEEVIDQRTLMLYNHLKNWKKVESIYKAVAKWKPKEASRGQTSEINVCKSIVWPPVIKH